VSVDSTTEGAPPPLLAAAEDASLLRDYWRSLRRICMIVVLLATPGVFVWLYVHAEMSLFWSLVLTVLSATAVRGLLDVFFPRVIPWPSLFGTDDERLREEDALGRRRLYFWTRKLRLAMFIGIVVTITWLFRGGSWDGNASYLWGQLGNLKDPQLLQTLIILPIFFLANFLLFFGPMMMMGISQMRGLEPGDADFGVKLADIRGQKEAKDEINKVVTLWQSGEQFMAAGGKRERGVLFLGPPGTGKTMLAKAIATGFNSPIVMMPGSGFAQTFIGMDVIIVRYMARKARKLAAKWGGSCIIFIDEIDAVGLRRNALVGGGGGSIASQVPGGGSIAPQIPGGGMFGGMGQMGLQSLLVVMDGIDNPPFFRRVFTNKINTYLDASFIVPRRLFNRSLRIPRAKPTGNQIYFVGATNVPLGVLDPALTRPGRMGRHIYFRTPTKRDRQDIFDLYLNKIAHEPELDTEHSREELARVTNGYSPASIEQVCNLALMYAQHSGRQRFGRDDLLEAMVTVEAGTALGWGYERDEEKLATAIHEAGHAVCSFLYMKGTESTRLSIRRRGATGGHHQAVDVEERVFKFKGDLFDDLVWTLGAYAAEHVFYGENTQGVGGDLGFVSGLAGTMVGRWGMTPRNLGHDKRFETIGRRLLAAAGPGDIPLPPMKQKDEAIIVGQAYVTAWNAIRHNQIGVRKIAEALVRAEELYGDDVVKLLSSVGLEAPEIDYAVEESWPVM
jgi:cell division protease FtsH